MKFDGVPLATSDFSTGITTVVHDPQQVTTDLITTTIEALGHTVVRSTQTTSPWDTFEIVSQGSRSKALDESP